MNSIKKLFKAFSKSARKKRAAIFRSFFLIDQDTRILDLGSESGSNIHSVLDGTLYNPKNVYIADIDESLIQIGAERYGFIPVLINESKRLPFDDDFFDIVYCSSVIEHVTIAKDQVWILKDGKEFMEISYIRQKEFAEEIRRIGKQYFVQTPYKHFVIESHSWLPFVAWLPRSVLVVFLKFTNRFWVKKTTPDWNLLDRKKMSELFPDSITVQERVFGLTKSIMAIKSFKN